MTKYFIYSIPIVNGELPITLTFQKNEKVAEYMVFPDKHVFATTFHHVELRKYLIDTVKVDEGGTDGGN